MSLAAVTRAAAQERRDRRRARVSAVTSRLPRRTPRVAGVLAERRRRQLWATIMVLVVLNVVVWASFPAWSSRALTLMVSALAAPVLHTLLFRRT